MYKLARVASPHKCMYTNHLKTHNQLKGMVIIATRLELLRHQISALVNSLCLQSLDQLPTFLQLSSLHNRNVLVNSKNKSSDLVTMIMLLTQPFIISHKIRIGIDFVHDSRNEIMIIQTRILVQSSRADMGPVCCIWPSPVHVRNAVQTPQETKISQKGGEKKNV